MISWLKTGIIILRVSSQSYRVYLRSAEEVKEFLRSDESLVMYPNHNDIFNLANMFGINGGVFTFNCRNGDPPRWTWMYPDKSVYSPLHRSRHIEKDLTDLYLYHEDNSHYEYLIWRPLSTNHLSMNNIEHIPDFNVQEEHENHISVIERDCSSVWIIY